MMRIEDILHELALHECETESEYRLTTYIQRLAEMVSELSVHVHEVEKKLKEYESKGVNNAGI
ncbi:MAG: hypothetical protein LC660_08665 [Desulfobacteraceae bacterium]|nr:hypothetical protein [Desulfobacteraceae bacterium]